MSGFFKSTEHFFFLRCCVFSKNNSFHLPWFIAILDFVYSICSPFTAYNKKGDWKDLYENLRRVTFIFPWKKLKEWPLLPLNLRNVPWEVPWPGAHLTAQRPCPSQTTACTKALLSASRMLSLWRLLCWVGTGTVINQFFLNPDWVPFVSFRAGSNFHNKTQCFWILKKV